MALKHVAGDLYADIDGQILEIKRQLRQKEGYPYDPMQLVEHLQAAIEGNLVNRHGKVFKKEPATIISIDRTKPFDPVEFLGQGWTIEEQDDRSLALVQVDLANIQLKYMLKSGENSIGGEERLKRLKKEGYIRLDAKVFQTLWKNQKLIPESWKEKISGDVRFVFFDGTVLRRPYGDRYVLGLDWNNGQWHWDYGWLECHWRTDDPSAVLANI